MLITSRSNETVKQARALQDAKKRRETGLHLVESDKLVRDAILSGAVPELLFLEEGFPLPGVPGQCCVFEVTGSVMEALCASRSPQHCAAVFRTPDLSAPQAYPDGLIIVLDTLQDAGNLGTILRTADAFGAAGVLVGDGSVDPFGPKALRAAMGSTYHLPIWRADLVTELPRLKAQGFTPLCGHLHGSEVLPPVTGKMALVIGNEGNGVSDAVASQCVPYRLPMRGRAESLNAAMAAGILIYELSGRMYGA